MLFGIILYRNRKSLNSPETVERFGAMYVGMDSTKAKSGSYSVVFLVRRSIFVLITFVLYDDPSLQIISMLALTMVYLCFIAHMNFHETVRLRRIEMLNECILIGICYHFVLLIDPYYEQELKEFLGKSIFTYIIALLGINTLIIILVNYEAVCRKLKLRKMRKLAEKR